MMADLSHSAVDDQDEWEYEYDENETEDFYFTLDITSHVSDALVNPDKKRRQRPSKKAPTNNQSKFGTTSNGIRTSQAEPDTTTGASVADEETDDPAGELQLIGLHTENPYVRFNDRHYSCYWATDLGTQFHISKAGATKEPLRKGHVVDVVSTGRVKLYGKPVTIKEREKPKTTRNAEAAVSPAPSAVTSGGSSDVLVVRAGQQLKVPEERITDAKSRAQASFLERLSAIKLRKGETDFVPVSSVKNYVMPANKDEIRQRALGAQAGRSPSTDQQTGAETGPSNLGKRSFDAMQGPQDPIPAAMVPSDIVQYDVPVWTSSAAHSTPQNGT